VREELADLHLSAEVIDRNLQAARRVYGSLSPVFLHRRPPRDSACPLHTPAYVAGPQGAPVICAPGNSRLRHTGAWRVFRPVIDREACTRCGICFALCSDGAIALDASAHPVIDYDNCKGCMICFQECPIHCIREEKEVRAW